MSRVVQPNILPEIQGFPTRDFPSRDFPSNEEVLKEWYGTSVPIETNIGETYKKDLLIDPFTQAGMIDLITAVVAEGMVYSVVALVLVKSTFLFTNVLAIMP